MEANATEPGARLIHNVFEKLGKIVIDYLEQDEKVFFTYLEQFSSGKYLVDLPPRLLEMRKQHTSIKHLFKKLRVFTNNYAVPKQASAALKLCYAQLFNFEQDVLKHLFLEEDVLFPRLLELNERQVN
ncbi:MAG: hemerythrin domain-containing protein [Bacteroidota bacterium]